jgi:transposase
MGARGSTARSQTAFTPCGGSSRRRTGCFQAGWHVSKRLSIPDNITLLPLPPKSPELNPVENIWQFMRDNWLSNRVFKSYDDILDHCCFAWNKLIDMPWKIMSIGTRDWVYRS